MSTLSSGAAPGWMTMRIADVDFALPIEVVGEVIATPPLSTVPMVPAWVAGIVSLRGEVVAVVDPGLRLLGTPASRDGRLVLAVINETGERVGLILDAVTGLIDRRDSTMTQADADAGTLPARFVAGSVSGSDGGRIPVVALHALIDPELAGAEG